MHERLTKCPHQIIQTQHCFSSIMSIVNKFHKLYTLYTYPSFTNPFTHNEYPNIPHKSKYKRIFRDLITVTNGCIKQNCIENAYGVYEVKTILYNRKPNGIFDAYTIQHTNENIHIFINECRPSRLYVWHKLIHLKSHQCLVSYCTV